MFAETGIIGGGLFLALVILALKQGHRAAGETGDQLTTVLLAGLIGSAAAAIFDFDWQFPSVFLLFWLIAGVTHARQEVNFPEENQANYLLAAILFSVPAIYGLLVLSAASLQPAITKYWDRGGDKVFSLSASGLSKSHPQLEEGVFETAKRKMAPAEFGAFIKRQFPQYQYNNLMLARVLSWQKYFGSKQDVITTAAVILDNDPLDKQAQQALQEAVARSPGEK